MEKECEFLSTCGFFKKYQNSKEVICRGFIRRYCKGPKENECKRKEYRMKYGKPPSDDMLPNGLMMEN